MESSATLFPDLKWAQRRDRLFVTCEVPNLTDYKFNLTESTFSLCGNVEDKKYLAEFDLFAEVNVEESKWNDKGRYLIMNIVKKDQDADEYWPRLTKEKVKNPHLKVDWSKWVDEDDEGGDEDQLAGGMGDFDPEQMKNFNMGDFGDDSDDEEEEASGEVKDEPKEEEDAEADLDDLDQDEEVDASK